MKTTKRSSKRKASKAKGDDVSKASDSHEQSWGHGAVVLIRDLACLHLLLQKETGDETNPKDDFNQVSRRIFKILDAGHAYELPPDERKPESFWKDRRDGEDTKNAASDIVYTHSLEFVSSLVRECATQEVTIGLDRPTVGTAGKDVDSIKDAKDAQAVSETLGPLPQDIELLPRDGINSKATGHSEQAGNERLLRLVDQYVLTYNDGDRLSTLTSKKRAQAALAILNLLREPEVGKKDVIIKVPARFLVATTKGSKEKWCEVDRMEAAEITLILLFERFLERDRKPIGTSTTGASAEEDTAGTQRDFSEPGTVAIETPDSCDVLFGRGGLTNNHPGNKRFRDVISLHRSDYVSAVKVEKPNVARRIVKAIRAGSPPGRFLKKNPKDDMWYDVGDRNAAEKTSQALREKNKSKHQGQSPASYAPYGMKRPHGDGTPLGANSRIRLNEPGGVATSPQMANLQAGMAQQPFGGVAESVYRPYSVALRTRTSELDDPQVNSNSGGKKSKLKSKNPNASESLALNVSATRDGEKKAEKSVAEDKPSEYPDARDGDRADSEKEEQNPVDEDGNIVVTDSDILCGRGGLTNHHRGNKRFRDIVSLHRPDYVRAPKVLKPNVARLIVRAIRKGDPPGRFLKKDEKSGLWYDIGDKRAAEKASQALREKPAGGCQPTDANAATMLAPRPAQVPFYNMNPSMMPGILSSANPSIGSPVPKSKEDSAQKGEEAPKEPEAPNTSEVASV